MNRYEQFFEHIWHPATIQKALKHVDLPNWNNLFLAFPRLESLNVGAK